MIAREAWQAALREATEAPLPDTDAMTCPELAIMLGVNKSTALRRVEALVTAGKAERTTKLKRRCDGAVICVPAYRLLTKGPSRK